MQPELESLFCTQLFELAPHSVPLTNDRSVIDGFHTAFTLRVLNYY